MCPVGNISTVGVTSSLVCPCVLAPVRTCVCMCVCMCVRVASKPRFFNRVHTGYEWNKYNQTHYDHDNPPPKIVQGYKFNIFYPDLIDKSKAPTFKLEGDSSPDTKILRFGAAHARAQCLCLRR